ncbi:MAG: alanine racemase, partial [bacterium]|nr:alanine racemase [bacterium]
MQEAHRGSVGEGKPRSWAEIDHEAFALNLRTACDLAPGRRILAVLKADAYGHGAVALARTAVAAAAAMPGAGDSSERLEL